MEKKKAMEEWLKALVILGLVLFAAGLEAAPGSNVSGQSRALVAKHGRVSTSNSCTYRGMGTN